MIFDWTVMNKCWNDHRRGVTSEVRVGEQFVSRCTLELVS